MSRAISSGTGALLIIFLILAEDLLSSSGLSTLVISKMALILGLRPLLSMNLK